MTMFSWKQVYLQGLLGMSCVHLALYVILDLKQNIIKEFGHFFLIDWLHLLDGMLAWINLDFHCLVIFLIGTLLLNQLQGIVLCSASWIIQPRSGFFYISALPFSNLLSFAENLAKKKKKVHHFIQLTKCKRLTKWKWRMIVQFLKMWYCMLFLFLFIFDWKWKTILKKGERLQPVLWSLFFPLHGH